MYTVDGLTHGIERSKHNIGVLKKAIEDERQTIADYKIMIDRIKEETLAILYRIQIAEPEKIDDYRQPRQQQLVFSGGDAPEKKKPQKRSARKVGRNAPCPCGSGKKFKKCCGK